MLELFLLVLALVAGFVGMDALLASRQVGLGGMSAQGLLLLLIAAVFLTGACIVGKLNVIQRRLTDGATGSTGPAWWGRRKH